MSERIYKSIVSWSAAVKRRDSWTCQDCGATERAIGKRAIHAHHIIPLRKGGQSVLSNGITVCHPCHGKRHIGEERRFISQPEKDYYFYASFLFCISQVTLRKWIPSPVPHDELHAFAENYFKGDKRDRVLGRIERNKGDFEFLYRAAINERYP